MSEAPKIKLPLAEGRSGDLVRSRLREAESNDLVFAVSGYIGSGLTWVASALAEQAKGAGFAVETVKLSELLATEGKIKREHDAQVATTTSLQDVGDRLREKYGESIVAGLAVRKLRQLRGPKSDGTPKVFILDSLKHPDEVEVLRTIYGSSFYLIGVLCSESTRTRRLEIKYKHNRDKRALSELMQRDKAGTSSFGQQVRKTVHRADFFVANEDSDKDSSKEGLGDKLDRFLDAVIGRKVVRPTKDERGMHAAWSASLRSSCLSRQVGASVINQAGELVATGANDAPAFGGGLYEEGKEPDFRCFKSKGEEDRPYCRNDRKKSEIYRDIFESLEQGNVLVPNATSDGVQKAVEATRVKDLIEFSRAIHAEMDAILSMARDGATSPVGCTLYSTTFPCHSCARHIVAAGIHEVLYIEPYTKSLAEELHGDAIQLRAVTAPVPNESRVVFRLFSGIAPRRFPALFEKRADLKDSNGALRDTKGTKHSSPMLTGSFIDLEQQVADKVTDALNNEEVST